MVNTLYQDVALVYDSGTQWGGCLQTKTQIQLHLDGENQTLAVLSWNTDHIMLIMALTTEVDGFDDQWLCDTIKNLFIRLITVRLHTLNIQHIGLQR